MRRSLQQRYERLLRWYPREHREIYEREMLGVLMDGAPPGRTRPTLTETVNLLGGALGSRLDRTRTELAGMSWRYAVAVIALLAPATLFVREFGALLDALAWGRQVFDDPGPRIGPSVWAPPLCWGLATLAALLGRRWPALVLGWVGVAAEVGVRALMVYRFGVTVLPPAWPLLLALVAALSQTPRGGTQAGLRLLGRRRAVPLALLGGYLAGGHVLSMMLGGAPGWIGMLVWGGVARAAVALAALAILLSLDPAARRRVLAVLLPLILFGVLEAAISGRFYTGGPGLNPVTGPALLLLAALAGFGLGVELIRRRELRGAR